MRQREWGDVSDLWLLSNAVYRFHIAPFDKQLKTI